MGSMMPPRVNVDECSGERFGLPPVIVVNWKLQLGLLASMVGHLMGSREPLPVTARPCDAYRSVKEGARNPVPAEPRSRNQDSGCQRRDTLGFKVLPTP